MFTHEETPLLEALGISPAEEEVYGILTDAQSATVDQVARVLGMSDDQTGSILRSLQTKGLINSSAEDPQQFIPVAPDLALRVLILRRQEELERARMGLDHFLTRFRDALAERPSTHLLELVRGRDAVVKCIQDIHAATEREIQLLDRPPYAMDRVGQNESELELLARGVAYRAIYDPEGLEQPGAAESARLHVEAGEDARVLSGVPLKLVISDRRLGFIPVSRVAAIEGGVLVHESSLLDALMMLFEMMWARAAPFGVSRDAEPALAASQIDAELVALLCAGQKDETIARQLGVALRTVRRRVQRVMLELGARTRFQAGVLATIRGWVVSEPGDDAQAP